MTDRQQGLIEDFRAIRGEMVTIFNTRLWGTATYLLIAGGVLAARLNGYLAAKFVFIIYATLPFLIHTANRERARIRMGNYIKEVIEKNIPGLYWEHFLEKWRDYDPREETKNEKSEFKKAIDCWMHIFSLVGVQLSIVVFSEIYLFLQPGCTIEKVFGFIGFMLNVTCYAYFYSIFRNARKLPPLIAKIKRDLDAKDRPLTSSS